MIKTAIIKKLPESGKYRLYSHKKDEKGHRKNLGTFDSYEAAQKHEKQIQFFKGQGADDQNAHDKETKAIKAVSDVARFLEQAGYISHASELYAAMDSFGCFDDAAVDGIPDDQLNTENQSALSNTGFSQGTFNSMEATVASLANRFDKLGLFEEADVLDEILKEATENFGKNINFSQNGDNEPQIQVNYFTNTKNDQISKNKNFDDLHEAVEFFEHLKPETDMDAEDHPAELYHNPSFIKWLQKNSNVAQMLKDRYKKRYLGMIDSMDAYFNPRSEKLLGQNWENDPVKFLKWYVGSKEEREDLEWDPEKENLPTKNELQELEEIAKSCGTLEFEDLIKNPHERVISELYSAKDPEYKKWEAELQHLSKIHYEAVKNRQANEADNIDALVNLNGQQASTPLNNGSEFGGLSDAYFYQSYQNLDHRYKIAP